MGYESRIIVMNRTTYDEPLAVFNLSKINGELLECFERVYNSPSPCFGDEKPTDIYLGNGFQVIKADSYGEHAKECSLFEFLPMLATLSATENYRRYDGLFAFLMAIRNRYDNVIIVHLGY